MESELWLKYTHDQRLIVDYVYVASAALVLYDHLCNIDMEVSLIWSSRWTYTKVLFIMTKYLLIPALYSLLYNQMKLSPSLAVCSWSFRVFNALGLLSIFCAECIFMIRTWAVWNRNRKIGFSLSVLSCGVAGFFIMEHYSMSKSVEVTPPSFPQSRGCYRISHASVIVYLTLFWLAFVDAVVLSMMLASAFQAYKHGDNLKLRNVIHRDGILFYVYILCVVLIDAIMLVSGPPTLGNMMYPAPTVIYSVLSTRVILNIRSVAKESHSESRDLNVETELHTTWDLDIRELPLTFREENSSEETIDAHDFLH